MLGKLEVVGLYFAKARPAGKRQGSTETLKSNLPERVLSRSRRHALDGEK